MRSRNLGAAKGKLLQHLWILFLCALPAVLSQENATVTVRGLHTIAETEDNFVCATMDWWPPNKCNYNQCPWGNASALNLNLDHPFLAEAIEAFGTLRIRLGGTLQDLLVYGVPSLGTPCTPFTRNDGAMLGFTKGCLSLDRWDELNHLFQKTGAVITFGLNALYGRQRGKGTTLWVGDWNSTNARDFINYTISKGYPVDSWEFGNELSGRGIGARVRVEQYAKDLIALKSVLKDLYNHSHVNPLLLAPGGFFDQQWYAQLLESTGSGVLNAMTHHVYNLGAGRDTHIADRILDPQSLNWIEDAFRNLELTILESGPWASAWVGEAGGAYNSGSKIVSNKFLDSFWYLDQLGMASKHNTKTYCRQTLIGGNYGLLDRDTFVPNPDYYSALLWHRLMGKGVLAIDIKGSPFLRAYAHCRKGKADGVTVLLINLNKTTSFTVDLAVGKGSQSNGSNVNLMTPMREEYHLSAPSNNPLSQVMLINGIPLNLTESGHVPALDPVFKAANSPVSMAPLSIAFVVFPHFAAGACGSDS